MLSSASWVTFSRIDPVRSLTAVAPAMATSTEPFTPFSDWSILSKALMSERRRWATAKVDASSKPSATLRPVEIRFWTWDRSLEAELYIWTAAMALELVLIESIVVLLVWTSVLTGDEEVVLQSFKIKNETNIN